MAEYYYLLMCESNFFPFRIFGEINAFELQFYSIQDVLFIMKAVIFLLFFVSACLGLKALEFSDVIEIEYKLNVGRKTMLLGQCASQKLDPVSSV